jgi:xanthine dehydrogenase small subunit
VPLHLGATSAVVAGRPAAWETAKLAAATAISEISPISDVRGSADYKRLLLGQLILAHFVTLFRLKGGRP